MRTFIPVVVISALVALAGCESKPPAATPPKPAPAASAPAGGHHGGAVVELGTASVDGMSLKASRDAGELKPGGDAPIDVWIDGGLGGATVVRFWIGTADAKGSVKAKAAVEDGKWHTHADLPDPLPADSKLWIEIERKDRKTSVASFDLKK
jgi:hypothetical protein